MKDAVTRDTAHCIVIIDAIYSSVVRPQLICASLAHFDCHELCIAVLEPRIPDEKEQQVGDGVGNGCKEDQGGLVSCY